MDNMRPKSTFFSPILGSLHSQVTDLATLRDIQMALIAIRHFLCARYFMYII